MQKLLHKYEKLEAIMATVKEENIIEQWDLSGKHIEQRLYPKCRSGFLIP